MQRIPVLATFLTALGVLIGTGTAWGCSCVQPGDPVDEVRAADAALIGVVTKIESARRGGLQVSVRVDEDLKDNLPDVVRLATSDSESSCGLGTKVGARLGLLVYRDENGHYSSNLCSERDPVTLRQGAHPDPLPLDGVGPARFVVGGSLGVPRSAALDAHGRLLALSAEGGDISSAVVCPGGQRVVEVPAYRDEQRLVVRDVATFAVVSSVRLPIEHRDERGFVVLHVRCQDTAGSRLVAALTTFDRRTAIARFADGRLLGETKVAGGQSVIGARAAFVGGERGAIRRVDLSTGRTRSLGRERQAPESLDATGRFLAISVGLFDEDGPYRFRLLDLRRGGRVIADRKLPTYRLTWAGDRLVGEGTHRAVVYDRRLRPQRTLSTRRRLVVDGARVVWTANGRLHAQEVRTGRTETLGRLPVSEITTLSPVGAGATASAARPQTVRSGAASRSAADFTARCAARAVRRS